MAALAAWFSKLTLYSRAWEVYRVAGIRRQGKLRCNSARVGPDDASPPGGVVNASAVLLGLQEGWAGWRWRK
jgi:hypothetical protein